MKILMKKALWISGFSCVMAVLPYRPAAGAEPSGVSGIDYMSADAVLLVVYVVLALGFSFLCSVAEAVLLSVTPSYIQGQKKKHPKKAVLLKRLKLDNIDRSLAAILTLNTIAHTVGAIGAGAKATVVFGSGWVGIFSAVITLMILFLSEIIPKTIGAVYWSQLTGPVSIFVHGLIVILLPVVWLSERVTKLISRGKELHIFTRDEFAAMASVAEKTGELHSKESKMIHNLLRFKALNISDIMTPRTVITALAEDMRISDSLHEITQTPFSRLPLYTASLDDISGFVLKEDVLIFNAQKREDEKLKTLKRDIIAIPRSVSMTALLERFLKERQHIAIVVNEHGGTDGLVTLEDLIETLMGMEIVDETDNIEDMRVLARKHWEKRAKVMGVKADILIQKTAEPGFPEDDR